MPAWNRIYDRAPIPVQDLLLGLAGWWTRRRRFGPGFRTCLAAAEERAAGTAADLEDFRDRRLRAYVLHCATTVPFWRERFRTLGVDPRDIRTLADLAVLPPVTKAEVRRQQAAFYSEAWPPRRCLRRGTGGTTGASLRFRATPAAVSEQWAVWWRYWRWHGLDLDTWCGYFVGLDIVPRQQRRPPYWRVIGPRRQVAFSSFHLRPETLPGYIDELRRRRLPWLHGYPSVLTLVAAHVLETGADLGYQPRWITTGAENLMPHQVDTITRAFGTRPRQHYGLAEGVANLSECPAGFLHVDEDFAAVEFLPHEVAGAGYRLVGSNLSNPAFCLLRYDTGDVVQAWSPAGCTCGRPGRLADAIDGRKEDVLILGDGTRIGRLAHVFQGIDCVAEAQFVQHEPGAVELLIVPRDPFTGQDERAVLAAARRRLGDATRIELRRVASIARERNGKLRFVRVIARPSDATAPSETGDTTR